jgi:hypothetical protein
MKNIAVTSAVILASFMAVELPPQMPELIGNFKTILTRQLKRKFKRNN